MSTQTDFTPPIDVVEVAALRLAPLLMRDGINVTVGADGVIETHNPAAGARMRQLIVLRGHQGGLWWHWVWPGPERAAPPELDPMVPADDVREAARLIAKVLAVVQS